MTATSVATADNAAPDPKGMKRVAKAAETSAAAPKTIWVIDTTATPDSGPRTHHQMVDGLVKPFVFENGKPVEMPREIAHKFLKDPAFIATDKDGRRIAYKRTPKQPDELGAGEALILDKNETVARFDELTSQALYQRATALVGGERFVRTLDSKPAVQARAEMIDFIVKTKEAIAAANKEKAQKQSQPDRAADDDLDDFTPEPSDDDEDLAA